MASRTCLFEINLGGSSEDWIEWIMFWSNLFSCQFQVPINVPKFEVLWRGDLNPAKDPFSLSILNPCHLETPNKQPLVFVFSMLAFAFAFPYLKLFLETLVGLKLTAFQPQVFQNIVETAALFVHRISGYNGSRSWNVFLTMDKNCSIRSTQIDLIIFDKIATPSHILKQILSRRVGAFDPYMACD